MTILRNESAISRVMIQNIDVKPVIKVADYLI